MKRINQLVNRLASIGSDKYLHFLACQMISFLTAKIVGCLVPYGWALLVGFVTAVTGGLVKEFRDRRETGNMFSWGDVIADLAGAAVGVVISL